MDNNKLLHFKMHAKDAFAYTKACNYNRLYAFYTFSVFKTITNSCCLGKFNCEFLSFGTSVVVSDKKQAMELLRDELIELGYFVQLEPYNESIFEENFKLKISWGK